MPLRHHARPSSRGFTLIELLVVISIIALLIGILLPALGAARASARDMQCLSNTRQVTIAGTAYATDNKDFYARATSSGIHNGASDNKPGVSYWSALLTIGGYGSTVEMFQCPIFDPDPAFSFDPYNGAVLAAMLAQPAHTNWRSIDYGTNWSSVAGRVGYKAGAAAGQESAQTHEIKDPTSTVYVGDSWFESQANSLNQRGSFVIWGFPTTFGGVHARHSNMAINIGWVDGHSSALPVGAVSKNDLVEGPWAEKHLGQMVWVGVAGTTTPLNKWDDD